MDHPHLTHPHNLVGPHCDKGVCTVLIDNEDMRATFTNLGIQCVKKKEVEPELSKRKLLRVDPFRQGFAHKKGNVHNAIDLNVVRICFQVMLKPNTPRGGGGGGGPAS